MSKKQNATSELKKYISQTKLTVSSMKIELSFSLKEENYVKAGTLNEKIKMVENIIEDLESLI